MTKNTAKDPLADPASFLLMTRGLLEAGRIDKVSKLITKASAEHGASPLWEATIRQAVAHLIPGFHPGMLRDAPRNVAYRKGIEELVPGKTVLDIGTGSGLLAMMAVRAGARHVFACETNEMLAAAAREVIAANGMADDITLFAKSSMKLDRDKDLDGGPDVIVSELIADDLMSEALVPSLNDASERLCKPETQFLPGKAWVKVALAEYDKLPDTSPIVEGLDLSLHTRLLPHRIGVRPDKQGLTLRSDAARLMSFDYKPGLLHPRSDRSSVSVSASGGHANVIAQWIGFECGSSATYENAPGSSRDMHWRIQLTPIEPVLCDAGQRVEIEAYRDQLGAVLDARIED